MDYYKNALGLKEESIRHRRYLHSNAEYGLSLPKTVDYIIHRLTEYGLNPKRCGHGVVASLGTGDKEILIRADMDALPMKEESGEAFACTSCAASHSCGHDFHAAILLTVAKMLKEQEGNLKGRVKFMFQPAEEIFEGAKDMIQAGLFADGKPDASIALHVTAGHNPLGLFFYNSTSTMMASVDGFRIHIQGKGGHGAYPHTAINPITVGAHIHLALSELIASEADPADSCVLSICHFEAGSAPNIIPNTAFMEGTLRTKNEDTRKRLVKRIFEICDLTAKRYGASATVESLSDMASLRNDSTLAESMVRYIMELPIPNLKGQPGITTNASDDYAMITNEVPSFYFNISAGFADERGDFGIHHPKVRFNEDALPIGASMLAHCVSRWLEEHSK